MNRTLVKAALIAGLGLAVAAPVVASAASTPSSPPASSQSSGQHLTRIEAIAQALGITAQEARTAMRQGAIQGLATASHLTTAQVEAKLKGLKLGSGVRVGLAHHIGRQGVLVGLKAVAAQLNMSPGQLRQAIRKRDLKLPAGTTVQSLQGTAQTAVEAWMKDLAAKHPKLTAERQQKITQRVVQVVGKLLTRATTPGATTPGATTPQTPGSTGGTT